MKYDNTLQVMYRFLFIFYLGLLVFYAATGYSPDEELGYFVCIALFVFCLIFLTFIFIKYKHIFHYTYFLEDKVKTISSMISLGKSFESFCFSLNEFNAL